MGWRKPGLDVGGGLTVGGLLVLLSYLASLYAPLETLAYLSTGFATASAGRGGFLMCSTALKNCPSALSTPPFRLPKQVDEP